jgi:hypothetical protein
VATRWVSALAAVVAGNALYFILLVPALPARLRHRPFALDAGLGLDFVICLALYLGLGRLNRTGRRP